MLSVNGKEALDGNVIACEPHDRASRYEQEYERFSLACNEGQEYGCLFLRAKGLVGHMTDCAANLDQLISDVCQYIQSDQIFLETAEFSFNNKKEAKQMLKSFLESFTVLEINAVLSQGGKKDQSIEGILNHFNVSYTYTDPPHLPSLYDIDVGYIRCSNLLDDSESEPAPRLSAFYYVNSDDEYEVE